MCVISTSDIFSVPHTRCENMNADSMLFDAREQYLCKFEIDTKELKLRDLAEKYHRITEEYDKKVCTGVSPYDGSVMPVTSFQAQAINRNAKEVLKMICIEGEHQGFTKLEVQKAIRDFNFKNR